MHAYPRSEHFAVISWAYLGLFSVIEFGTRETRNQRVVYCTSRDELSVSGTKETLETRAIWSTTVKSSCTLMKSMKNKHDMDNCPGARAKMDETEARFREEAGTEPTPKVCFKSLPVGGSRGGLRGRYFRECWCADAVGDLMGAGFVDRVRRRRLVMRSGGRLSISCREGSVPSGVGAAKGCAAFSLNSFSSSCLHCASWKILMSVTDDAMTNCWI